MHSKTHFKFQFKSSRISPTSAHIIFFLNTTLHQDPKKLEPPNLGLPNSRYGFYKTASKLEINELAFKSVSLTAGTPGQSGPRVSERKTEEAARDGMGAVLARRRRLLR